MQKLVNTVTAETMSRAGDRLSRELAERAKQKAETAEELRRRRVVRNRQRDERWARGESPMLRLRVTPEVRIRLSQLAHLENTTVSCLVRRFIDDGIISMAKRGGPSPG